MTLKQRLYPMFAPLIRTYWRLRRPLTLGARAIVEDEAGRILLVRHTYIEGWYLPGGGVERNETVRTALRRELDEEVGVILTGEARYLGLLANFREFKSDHVNLFHVPAGSYRREERRSPEILEMGFYEEGALPEGASAATRRRIDEFLTGKPLPEMW